MSRILPIIFNAKMVQAIQDGRKTVTRRAIKYDRHDIYKYARVRRIWYEGCETTPEMVEKYVSAKKAPYQPGDILYVRETWGFKLCIECMDEESCKKTPTTHEDPGTVSEGCYIYRAGHPTPERIIWHPSIHMPKAAARIWLKVKNVRVERLQDITETDAKAEGAVKCFEVIRPGESTPVIYEDKWGYYAMGFKAIWDSTIKKADINKYGWGANPWVWVIEFERCEKPEVKDV